MADSGDVRRARRFAVQPETRDDRAAREYALARALPRKDGNAELGFPATRDVPQRFPHHQPRWDVTQAIEEPAEVGFRRVVLITVEEVQSADASRSLHLEPELLRVDAVIRVEKLDVASPHLAEPAILQPIARCSSAPGSGSGHPSPRTRGRLAAFRRSSRR